MTNRSPGWWIS